jgi:hypothetical protein
MSFFVSRTTPQKKTRHIHQPMSKRSLHSDALKLVRDARKRAKKKRLDLTIVADDIIDLYSTQRGLCTLSGRPMQFGRSSRNSSNAISLDRIIAGQPYSRENVQLLCRCVNIAKSTLTTEEFVSMCSDVSTHHTTSTPATGCHP